MKKTRRRCVDKIFNKATEWGLILSIAKILSVDDESIELRKKLKDYIILFIIQFYIYAMIDYEALLKVISTA